MKVISRYRFALFLSVILGFQTASAQLTTVAKSVQWTSLRGVVKTSTTLKKTAATNWESGSALSVQKISTSGFARFYFRSGRGIVGLTTYNGTPTYNNISNGFEFLDGNRVVVIEKGAWVKDLGAYNTGWQFHIERRNGKFNYMMNGAQVYTSVAPNALPLRMAVLFRNTGSWIYNPRMALISSTTQPTATPTRTPVPTYTGVPPATATFTPTSRPVTPIATSTPTRIPSSTPTRTPTRTPTPAPSVSSARYVSTGGSDSNDGSLGRPYRTIQYAIDVAARGTTIYVRAGTYTQPLNVTKGGLTIQSYPGERAIIAVPARTNTKAYEVAVRVQKEADHTTFRNLDISGGYYYALKTESNWDSGETPEYGASYLLVEDCRIYGSGNAAVKVVPGSDNVTIRRTEIFNTGLNGAVSSEGIDAVNADDFVLQDSHLHDTGETCVYVKGGSRRTIIERNLVENCNGHGIMLGQDSDWQWFDDSVNPSHYENMDGIVRNNIVRNTLGAGVAAQAAIRASFYNNTLVNVAQEYWGAMAISGVDHWTGPQEVYEQLASRDVTMVNNIIVHNGARPSMIIREFAGGLSSGLIMNNNRYYNTGGAAQFWDERNGFTGNLAQWKSHTGTDSVSTEGAPGIDGSERLVTGSACVDKGMTTNRVADDFEKKLRPRGVTYDIGAYEQ